MNLKLPFIWNFCTKPSSNYKIPYILVSLINHDGDSLDCGHYFSDVFNANTGTWWHCEDDNITKISGIPKGVILERVTKNRVMSDSIYVLLVFNIRTTHKTKYSTMFLRIHQHVQN